MWQQFLLLADMATVLQMSKKHPEIFGDGGAVSVVDTRSKPNEVALPFVRQGTHGYNVRYAYYSKEFAGGAAGHEVRKEAFRVEEAWSAADAVVQVAIYVDSLYASSRCKILEVKPCEK